jgi:hypothetical protein
LIETTRSWTHNVPPGSHQTKATYILLAGGDEQGGKVLGEKTVDLGNGVWACGKQNWTAPEDRTRAVTSPPDLETIEQEARQFRHWLWDTAENIADRDGQGTIIVISHAAIIEVWTQLYGLNMPNLGVSVCRLKKNGDGKVVVEQLSDDNHYRQKLGDYYVPPRGPVDEMERRRQIGEFIGKVKADSDKVQSEKPKIFQRLVQWDGVADFWAKFNI